MPVTGASRIATAGEIMSTGWSWSGGPLHKLFISVWDKMTVWLARQLNKGWTMSDNFSEYSKAVKELKEAEQNANEIVN